MLAFIHIRKTAGSTIDMILRQSFVAGHCRVRHGRRRSARPVIAADELSRCRWIYWGLRSVSGHGIVPHGDLEARFPGIRYFTFLRDPLARCASDYQFRVRRGGLAQSFQQWIESEGARNQQVKKIAGIEDAAAAIKTLDARVGFVGLVEQFDRSLVMLRRWIDDPQLDIRYQAKNVMSDASLKRRLLNDDRTRAMIVEANREDLRLYRYVTDHLFSQQIVAYGNGLSQATADFQSANQPLPIYPRQLFSTLLREVVYKPLAPALRNRHNGPVWADSSQRHRAA